MGSIAAAGRRGAEGFLTPVFTLARLGLVAIGAVYSIIALLATLTAFGVGGSVEGPRGALRAIGEQPFGRVMLGAVAVGLACWVAWRWVEAFVDPEQRGAGAKAFVARSAAFVSGVAYAGLALAASRGAQGALVENDRAQSVSATARLLELPFGRALVVAAAALLIGAGAYQVFVAVTGRFMREYDLRAMDVGSVALARRFGVLGLWARGLVFALVGSLGVVAGLEADPRRVRDQGGALDLLVAQPYGAALLGAVAIGLFAYGAHCLARARWRSFAVARS